MKPSPHSSVAVSSGAVSGYTTPSTRSAGHFSVSTPHAPARRPLHCEITADHSPVFRHARYIWPGFDCPHDLVRTILAGVSGHPSALLHSKPSARHVLRQHPPHDALMSSQVPSALHALRAGPRIPAGHSTCASLSAGVAGQLRYPLEVAGHCRSTASHPPQQGLPHALTGAAQVASTLQKRVMEPDLPAGHGAVAVELAGVSGKLTPSTASAGQLLGTRHHGEFR